jgi:ureidoacrylate peracid hydrolase
MSQPLLDFADRIDPGHTAILVVDMQNYFCAEGGYIDKVRKADMSANALLAERIMTLVSAGRSAGAMVVWIKANYERKYLSGQALAKLDEMGVELVCCEGGS